MKLPEALRRGDARQSLPARGARVEIAFEQVKTENCPKSLPARGARVEISRSERGLRRWSEG